MATYVDPPISEVAMSFGFEPLDLGTPQLLEMWTERFRARFPIVEEHPPFRMPVEIFDPSQPSDLGPGSAPALNPRLWFIDPTSRHLIQAQRDFFGRNWRRLASDDRYPRYPAIHELLRSDLHEFATHLANSERGPIVPTQVEVTFINHVDSREPDRELALADLLRTVRAVDMPGFGARETEAYESQHVIASGEEPVGRLRISARHVIRRHDLKKVVALVFTARGRPVTPDVDGVHAFISLGANLAHRAFDAITTEEMQESWGRQP